METPDTPVPTPAPVETLSIADVLALEQKVRDNEAARKRGDPLPHIVTKEDLRAALNAVRQNRGTLGAAKSAAAAGGTTKKASGKTEVKLINIEGL